MSPLEIRVKVQRLTLSASSEQALQRLSSYDWILFTSKNTVTFFEQTLRERRLPSPHDIKIAAVGPITAKELTKYGYTVHTIPSPFTVRALVRSLGKVAGLRILFPRSAIAPQSTIHTLRSKQAQVRPIPLYTTSVVPLSKTQKRKLLSGGYSSLIFKSPSGIQGLVSQLTVAEWEIVKKIPCSCIGSTTAREARRHGLKQISFDNTP